MPWMDWIAHKHSVFVHLPFAAAVLIPWALLAAQRPGRGIKPWWVTCRYLAWAGVVGTLMALFSGLLTARNAHLLGGGEFFSRGVIDHPTPFQLHQWLAALSLVFGILALKALHRKREEHQGIGLLGLFLGLLWMAATLGAGYQGTRLAHPEPLPASTVSAATTAPSVPAPPDPEATAPLRALDYLSLVPMHAEPVKSTPHGNRWIRVWVTPDGESAYREGKRLPEGSLVVMSTTDDRWGRPGLDPGPLYALEILPGGKSRLMFYWPRVPEAWRNETQGQNRAYWRGDDERLTYCLACHADGIAPLKDRSKWMVPKPKPKPKPVEVSNN